MSLKILALLPLLAAIATAFAVSCDDDGGSASVQDPRPSWTPRTFLPPPTWTPVVGTPTPDLSSAVSAEEAMEQLLAVPNVGRVVRAVNAQDEEGVLDLIAWLPTPCGYRNSVLCPEGVARGTQLPMVNVGETVQFWVTRERLRPAVTYLLSRGKVALRFAARGDFDRQGERGEGPIYYVGLVGPGRPVLADPPLGFPNTMTGFLFILDAGSMAPTIELETVGPDWTAAGELNSAALEILTNNPPVRDAAVAPGQ